MKTIAKKTSFAALAVMALGLVACGGAQTTSKKGMSALASDAPPPPTGKDKTADRQVSKEAAKDFAGAVAFFNEQAKGGWNSGSCGSAASRFIAIADENPKLIEARFNAGVAYQMCGDAKNAEEQYQKALKLNPNHAPSLGNLGQIYFRGGNEAVGKQYWDRALKADQKTSISARNGLAWLIIKEIRETNDRSKFSSLEKTAARHLSSVLAVESDNVEAYVLYSLLYQEGWERNKSRLDIAKLLLDEGEKYGANYAPLHNARGLLLLKRDNVSQALTSFRRAVELDPKFVEARMNVGNIVLGFRKYDEAKEQFDGVLAIDAKNYDATIGLGIAQRGLKDLDGAEASYNKAKQLDGRRGEAYYNLGVLYYSFRANQSDDLGASVAAYKKAKGYYEQFLSKSGNRKDDEAEAKATIKDADKIIRQLEDVMKQMKSGGQSGLPQSESETPKS